MKPEPLKDKVFYFDNLVCGMGEPQGKFVHPKVNADDVTSAVRWLKKEINNSLYTRAYKKDTIMLIDEAFEDAVKK